MWSPEAFIFIKHLGIMRGHPLCGKTQALPGFSGKGTFRWGE